MKYSMYISVYIMLPCKKRKEAHMTATHLASPCGNCINIILIFLLRLPFHVTSRPAFFISRIFWCNSYAAIAAAATTTTVAEPTLPQLL